MGALVRDFRMAVRALTRRPGVTALALLSLALAIGFCSAAFSLMDAFQWRDLAVREPARLVSVVARNREQRLDGLSWTEYQALMTRGRAWEGLLVESRQSPKVRLADRDDFPITAGVSENYFDLLGVRAAAGDVFHAGTGQDGMAVLSDHYWKTALGGDVHIIGRALPVGKTSLKIVGVLPPGFTGTNRGLLVDLFVPPQTFFGSVGFQDHLARENTDFEVVGRLRAGVTLPQARQEEEAILRQLESDGQEPAPGRKAELVAMTESSVRAKLAANAIFPATLLLVLIIAAANLANLRLVDNEARRRETGIRLALGAGRFTLLRQHWSEALLLTTLGTGLGLLIAAWLIDFVPAVMYAGESYIDYGVRLDGRTFAFSAAALVMVAVISALIPLSDAWRHRILPALHVNASVKSSRWLTALVVVQMAFVTAVTCSAGLLWRSLQNVAAIRPAMDPDRRLLLVQGYWEGDVPAAARAEVLATEFGGLPGVLRVAYARRALLSGGGGGAAVDVELLGQPKFSFFYDNVSPSYFATTGARILGGRGFSSADGPGSTPVVMVNQAFVRRFLAHRNPLGAWIRVDRRDRQIIGVVEDGPTIYLRERIDPYLYFAFAQKPEGYLTFFVESAGNPDAPAASVRARARRADSEFIVTSMRTLCQHMFSARKQDELRAGVTGGLALLGLVLAAAGLFGVTSYAVSRRIREFGLRVALGATGADLRRQVLRAAAVQAAIGIPLGWAMAWASRAVIEKFLYGVEAGDPWILAAASGVVAVVALLAALRPAVAAARVDPMVALRWE